MSAWYRIVVAITAMFLLIMHLPVQSSSLGQGIHIKYALEKTAFLVAEPIFLKIRIENLSDSQQVYQSHGLWREMMVLIRLSDGQVAPSRWGVLLPYEDPSVLKAGKSAQDGRNLLDYYGEGNRAGNLYLLPGEYKLFASGMTSDTVTFRVTEPTRPDDKAAAVHILWACEHGPELFESNRAEFDLFNKLITQYPNSVYAPIALNELITAVGVEEPYYSKAEQQEYAKMMVTKYPTFGNAYRALHVLDHNFIDANEREEVSKGLQEMKSYYSSPSIKKLVDELVAKISQ